MCFKIMEDDLFAIKERIYTRLGFKTYHHYRYNHNRQHRIYLCESNL